MTEEKRFTIVVDIDWRKLTSLESQTVSIVYRNLNLINNFKGFSYTK